MSPEAPRPLDAPPGALRQLQLLADLSQAFARSLDVEETLANAVSTILAFLDAEAASVFLLEAESRELVCRASAGPVPITGLRLPLDRGIVGRTLASGESQMVRDVSRDPDFNRGVDQATGFTTRSIMCTPLTVGERRLGVLQVLNKRRAPGLFGEHDLDVLRVLGASTALALHNARMAADLVEQKRIRQELELAREMQRRLLPPPRPPPFPLVGVNISAHEVSGDFYDFFDVAGGRIGFSIGDVSGKGLNAALLMVQTTSLLRCLGKAGLALPALLAQVNRELCETGAQGMFVCVFAGIYDPATDTLEWCNAGFPPALHRRPDGGFAPLGAAAPPLGILPDTEFPAQQLSLAGGTLYMYSDGVSEARDAHGQGIEIGGLQQLITRHAGLPADQRLGAIVDSLCSLNLRDDSTLLLLGERRPQTGQRLISIGFLAQPENLRMLRQAVADAARSAGCSEAVTEQLVLAVHEACCNIMRHAYHDNPSGQIILTIEREDGRLLFLLRDYAEDVDPRRIRPRSLDEVRPGGLGINFIDSIMDSWEFRTPDDGHGNLLVMTRNIG